MNDPSPFPLPLSRRKMEAIGFVTVQWAYLESQLDLVLFALWKISSVSSNQKRYPAASLTRRVEFGKAAIKHEYANNPEFQNQVLRILGDVKSLRQARNTIVKSKWSEIDHFFKGANDVPDASTILMRINDEAHFETDNFSTNRIEEIGHHIARLNDEICKVFKLAHPEPAPPSKRFRGLLGLTLSRAIPQNPPTDEAPSNRAQSSEE